jgi:hypothetical protein
MVMAIVTQKPAQKQYLIFFDGKSLFEMTVDQIAK